MLSEPQNSVWSRIAIDGGEDLEHRLWCAAIREIARVFLKNKETGDIDFDDESKSLGEQLITEWQNSSLPHSSDLAHILGELDYFQNLDIAWDERLPLAGRPYFDPSILSDIRCLLEDYPDARGAVTDEMIEDFYIDWRASFLLRILEEVKGMRPNAPA